MSILFILLVACPRTQPATPDMTTETIPVVKIPRGTVQIGTTPGLVPFLGERKPIPTRSVTLTRPFYMAITEVTNGQWLSIRPDTPLWRRRMEMGANVPATDVSFIDVVEWCNDLSESQGLEPAYAVSLVGEEPFVDWNRDANGWRLPTEAEWEYAARARQDLPYSGSTDPHEVGYVLLDKRPKVPAPVGSFAPNRWGLYDMTGNLWEWVWDADSLGGRPPTKDEIDPSGPPWNRSRICRGSGFTTWRPSEALIDWRLPSSIGFRGPTLGFRVVRNVR